MDRMPIAHILWGNESKISDWNASAEQVFGYAKEEILGKSLVDYIVPEPVRPQVREVIEKLLTGEETGYSEEGNNIRKDGAVISFFWYNTPLQDEAGTTFAVSSIVIDVTERWAADDALRESEEWFKTILGDSRDAIFLTTEDAQFAYVNPAACALTGYAEEALLRMEITDLHAPDNRVAFEQFFERIMAGEEIVSDSDILRKDGVRVATEFSNKRVLIGDKRFMHTVARDITKRK